MAAAGSSASPSRAPLPAALEPLIAQPLSEVAVLLDFDGVLSPIVDDPAAARPDPRSKAALAALSPSLALAACITGRSALQARDLLGLPEFTYSGLHGAELLLPGAEVPIVPEAFAADAERVAALIAEAEAEPEGLAGLSVEHKGPIVALHWRRSADPGLAEARAHAIGARAEAAGLRAGAGRAVLELRPGLKVTKGDGLRTLVGSARALKAVLVAGDDVTDLDAFVAASELQAEGRLTAAVRVAVAGPDAPPAVAAAADLVLADPAELGAVLQALASYVPTGPSPE